MSCEYASKEKRPAMRTVKEIKEDFAKVVQHMDDRRVIDMYRAEIVSGIAIDRLEEICNAERDGNLRIVTLCKNCCAWKKYPEGSRGYCDYHEKDTEGNYYCGIE